MYNSSLGFIFLQLAITSYNCIKTKNLIILCQCRIKKKSKHPVIKLEPVDQQEEEQQHDNWLNDNMMDGVEDGLEATGAGLMGTRPATRDGTRTSGNGATEERNKKPAPKRKAKGRKPKGKAAQVSICFSSL